jgi:hypothetical protein
MKWIYLLPSAIRALPELGHLPASERAHAFEAARRDLGWRRRLGVGAGISLVLWLGAYPALRWALDGPAPWAAEVAPLTFLAPMFLWRAASDRATVRHLRRVNRFCAACGYDLRATPGRCPECGMERGKAEGERTA